MNKYISCFLFFMFLQTTGQGQQIGHVQYTFIDSARNNRSIATEIYYPSISPGNNTAIAQGNFPLIVFAHGFVMDWSAYQNFWDTLVPENYILVFPKTESGFAPVHRDFADDLIFIVSSMKANGAGPVIPSTSIGSTSAIMGHSMGGGASFLAAENNTNITTMVSFAAANTNPSSITAAQNIAIPVLLFSGSNDCVAPPAQHQDLMYDSCSSTQKTQIYITGGGHCYFADSNIYCSFGEGTCSPSPTITRTEQHAVVNNYLKNWLAFFLKGECNKAQVFQDSLLSSAITYRQNQALSCASFVNENPKRNGFEIFPNPGNEHLQVITSGIKITSVAVYDLLLKEKSIPVKTISDFSIQLDISSLTDGLYSVTINHTIRNLFIKQ